MARPKRTRTQELQIALNERDDIKADEMRELMKLQYKIKCKFKSKKQKELSDTIKNNRITFVTGAPGTGKAQPLDSLLLTPGGWVEMGNINIGDDIIGDDGNTTSVIGIYPQGKKDVYEVVMDDGSKTQCCEEHLWFTQTVSDRKSRKSTTIDGDRIYTKSPKMGTVKELSEIKNSLNYSDGRLNHYIPIVKPVKFNENKIDIDPYILGLLIGDGGLTEYVSLTTNDDYIMNEYNRYIESIGLVNKESIKVGSDCVTLVSTKGNKSKKKNHLLNHIRNYGLNIKSNFKFIPNEYKFNSIHNRMELIRGLMDSDGFINKSSVYFTTVSERLKNDFCFIINSLGGTCRVTEKNTTYRYKDKKMVGKLAYNICINIDFNPFKLPRKSENFLELQEKRKYLPTRKIKEINFIGEKVCQCIMVDNESHLYVTNDFIVTHNTFVSLKTGLELIKEDSSVIGNMLLTTPIIEVSPKSIGALPGDLDMKINHYFEHFYDNMNKIVDRRVVGFLRGSGVVTDKIVNFIRGATFGDLDTTGEPIGTFCILDEAQNLTKMELKTYISRLGEGSKMVILGDVEQCDIRLPNGEMNALEDAVERFRGMDNIGLIEFDEDDIVRDPFLIEIMKRYKD